MTACGILNYVLERYLALHGARSRGFQASDHRTREWGGATTPYQIRLGELAR